MRMYPDKYNVLGVIKSLFEIDREQGQRVHLVLLYYRGIYQLRAFCFWKVGGDKV